MSDNKKDLTRIEDLGEYLHELNNEEESFEVTPDLPDVPTEESDFGSTDFNSDSDTVSEPDAVPDFDTESEIETLDFGNSEDSPFTTEDNTFGSDEVTFESSTDFSSENNSSDNDDPFTLSDESSSFSTEAAAEPEAVPFETSSFEDEKEESAFTAEPVSETELNPEPEIEPEPTYTPPAEESTFRSPENFDDLKKFAESSNFSGMGAEGNPSFSVLLKNVRYIEDVNDILAMMKELGLISDSEEQMKNRLMRGHLLVPRISEYAAIYLAHKLRRFDIDIQVGLSDEIHPPKHQETPETGLVSKHSLYQNQIHHFHFDDPKLEISQIIVAATSNLEGHQIIRYMGVASEHKMLDGHIVEDEGSQEIPRYYSELAQKLKAHALKAQANAVIGVNYQLTPLPSEYGMAGSKYRLSCTGNLVWVNKL